MPSHKKQLQASTLMSVLELATALQNIRQSLRQEKKTKQNKQNQTQPNKPEQQNPLLKTYNLV